MTRDQLAERVCLLFGWTGMTSTDSDWALAVEQAWHEWARVVGSDYIVPGAHPELDDREIQRLADLRRTTRMETLDRLLDADDSE